MVPELNPGDAVGNDVLGMYFSLTSRGYRVYLFTASGESKSGLPVYHYRDACLLLDREQSDILIYHCCNWDPDGGRELGRSRARLVMKYHNITPSVYMVPWSAEYVRATRLGRQALQDLVKMPIELFIADSEFNAAELTRLGVPASRNVVLPPFHIAEALTLKPDDRAVLAKLAQFSNNVLVVGRVVPNKGLELMLRALSLAVQRESLHSCLHIVGICDPRLSLYVESLKRIIEHNGIQNNVAWHGAVGGGALATFFRHVDLVWTTSQHEGFCVPVIEAMAFGKPVLSTSKAALCETGGSAAVYADGLRDIASKLVELLTDDEARFRVGTEGYRRFRSTFRVGLIQSKFIGIIEQLVAKRNRDTMSDLVSDEIAVADWFGLPNMRELIVKKVRSLNPPFQYPIDNWATRRDFVDWIFREARKESPDVERYILSEEVLQYASEIEVPPLAAYFSVGMRLVYRFSRTARATFSFAEVSQVNDFVRWYRRECPYGTFGDEGTDGEVAVKERAQLASTVGESGLSADFNVFSR
jgi:glycosyltransferase involved in cell wall biosynthesis